MLVSGQSIDQDIDHIVVTSAESINDYDTVLTGENIDTETGNNDHDHDQQTTSTIQPVTIAVTAGSTASIYSKNSESTTQTSDSLPVATVAVLEDSQVTNSVASSSIIPSQDTQNTQRTKTPLSTATATQTAHPQVERHIPSYEQWRKQVLDKKKPAEANERKQRKRKPYQESAVDVAIGSEEEIGFVFPNLDNGIGSKGGDDRFQHISDPLGNGPDLRQELKNEKDLIKAEYAKDPRDRFNHASSTCAASVVKASKDATSITAILNEGKDHYMLNRCTTKEKFFVVELCEEILVDTFVLGNYEFFSSTFKDFIVSVNRYPPRDDGWSILGHFQARNTRDAQVFKPAVPQLATYIRFDFVNHYGNEYYCPVTLLRVYGATALEQLKQEEEEEKRVAEEEKKLAELEKARQAAGEVEDAEETDDSYVEEVAEINYNERKENRTENIELTDDSKGDHESQDKPTSAPEAQSELDQPSTHGDAKLPKDTKEDAESNYQGVESEDLQKDLPVDDLIGSSSSPEHTEAGSSIVFQDKDKSPSDGEEIDHKDESTPIQVVSPETTLVAFEEALPTPTYHGAPDTLPPRVSTSPASIHDEGDWLNEDLGMITLSPKAKPTQPSKPPNSPKPPSSGVGTASSGTPSATDASSHSTPSPQHSSQESVYKNIVNRLKVLELNSSLSYQYLEEQSNIFNDILESSEQKINQLVSHLNEATRRLETLGRKYDQLAYSYKAHVEVDGEKRRQEFINLSAQVHLLVSQVVFQRQLFVICAITIISIIAFTAITRSTAMHYAIQQSPFGAKLRAISGHKRGIRLSDIASTVRIGSVEGLTQFDQSSLLLHHSGEGTKLTPPMSPISPLTPNPNHNPESDLLDNCEIPLEGSSHPDSGISLQDGRVVEDGSYSGKSYHPHSQSEMVSTVQNTESPSLKLVTNSQSDHFQVSRTPFPTPKSSFGPVRPFLHPDHINPSQQSVNQNDYRPESPVFQGPSGIHDDGHLSEADVAYMSRDMNVGRRGFTNIGPMPISPTMRRLSSGYSNHIQHPTSAATSRPLSSLRMDTTASLAALSRSDSTDSADTLQQSPDNMARDNASTSELSRNSNDEIKRGMQLSGDVSTRPPEMSHRELEEDVGFVSDSVLDSASEKLTDNRDRLRSSSMVHGDWDRELGQGEMISRHNSEEEDGYLPRESSKAASKRNTIKSAETEVTANMETTNDRTYLSRESSLKSKRKSSHNTLRSLDYSGNTSYKNSSAGAAIGLTAIGLGLEGVNPEYPTPLEGIQGMGEGQITDSDAQANEDSATVPQSQSQAYSEKRKKARKSTLPDDQAVPRRHVSYEQRKSDDTEATEELMYERGLDGDDERSPQISRKSGY
ncbi:hypothetical protein BGX27_006653 [Mortierella sp. AM989]|nr:hypothetical protein BGX27_006653 [Mortierella sp. AM989]